MALDAVLLAIKLVGHTRVEEGWVKSPSGELLHGGFMVTIDDGLPLAKQDYVRERVSEILHRTDYKVTVHSNTNLVIQTS